MAIVKPSNMDIYPKMTSEFIDMMKSTSEILDDEMYDDQEGIEETRKELKESIEQSEKEADDLNKEFQDSKQKQYEELKEISSVEYIVNKLRTEMDKDTSDSINKKIMKRNIKFIEDSLSLSIFLEKTFIPKKQKVTNEKYNTEKQHCYRKLNSSTKYQFGDISNLKAIIDSILVNENHKKYTTAFLYHLFNFFNKVKIEEYAVYITFIIGNIKNIVLIPDMEQNKILIENINKIFDTYYS